MNKEIRDPLLALGTISVIGLIMVIVLFMNDEPQTPSVTDIAAEIREMGLHPLFISVETDEGYEERTFDAPDDLVLPERMITPGGKDSQLVYLVGYADIPNYRPVTKEQVEQLVRNGDELADKISFGKSILSAVVLDWIVTPNTQSTCAMNYAYLDSVARTLGVEPDNYRDKMYVMSCGTNAGSSSVAVSSDGTITSWVRISGSKVSSQYVYNHERFHALQYWAHANAWDKSGFPDSSFTNIEYGDNEVMGSNNSTREPNSAFRDFRGWFSPSQVTTVTRDTTIYLTTLEAPADWEGVRCVKVPKTWTASRYGAVETFSDYLYFEKRIDVNGISVHTLAEGCFKIMCRASTNIVKVNGQVGIPHGQSWYDATDRVLYTAATPSTLRIQFNADPPPVPLYSCVDGVCVQTTEGVSLEQCRNNCQQIVTEPPGKGKGKGKKK
jgi:hypothetical protein